MAPLDSSRKRERRSDTTFMWPSRSDDGSHQSLTLGAALLCRSGSGAEREQEGSDGGANAKKDRR